MISLLIRSILVRTDNRSDSDATSTWQAAEEVRPVPPELRRLPEVQLARGPIAAIVVAVAFVLPHILGTADMIKATAVLIFGIIGISVVVLTGWAGQVSLGQMGFVARGGDSNGALEHQHASRVHGRLHLLLDHLSSGTHDPGA